MEAANSSTPSRSHRKDHSHSHSRRRNDEVDDFELFRQQAYATATPKARSSVSRPADEGELIPSPSTSPNSMVGNPVSPYRRGTGTSNRMGSLRNDSSFSQSIDVGVGGGADGRSSRATIDDKDKEFGGRRAYSVKTGSSASSGTGLRPGGRFIAAHEDHKSPRHSHHNSGSSLAVPEDDAVRKSPSRECVRNFESTSKGVVNKGDSFRSDGSSPRDSNTALNNDSAVSTVSPGAATTTAMNGTSAADDASIPPKASQVLGFAPPLFYVQMLGAAAVGKSSLCQQFLTSEFMGNIDPDELDSNMPDLSVTGDCQKHVFVKLDGQESIVVFIDTACHEETGQEVFGCVDAYMLVFAMDDRASFQYAVRLLADLIGERRLDIPFVLVSNKSDLVRRCDVDPSEARELANKYGCYFIETSASLNHHVDDLLVNLIKIVRLRHSTKRIKKNDSAKKVTGFLKRLSIRSRSKK